MATLQKFKFLATQCAIAGSPSRSPTPTPTSPVIHLRRRRTLPMLLGRVTGGGGRRLPPRHDDDKSDRSCGSVENGKELSVGNKLKDLFVSSPPNFGERVSSSSSEDIRERLLLTPRRGARFMRPTIRQRLLRRAWRPVLAPYPNNYNII